MAARTWLHTLFGKQAFTNPGGNRKRLQGGLLLVIGYILSPLSWWNDAVVNIPLAWLGASLSAYFWPSTFEWAFVISYWLTNLAGLALMHIGFKSWHQKTIAGKTWLATILITVLYTIGVILLMRSNIIVPLPMNLFE